MNVRMECIRESQARSSACYALGAIAVGLPGPRHSRSVRRASFLFLETLQVVRIAPRAMLVNAKE